MCANEARANRSSYIRSGQSRKILSFSLLRFFCARIYSFLSTHQLPEPMIHTDVMARSRTRFDANKDRRRPIEIITRESFRVDVDKRLLLVGPEGGEEPTEAERRVRVPLQSKSGLIRMYLIGSGGRATRKVQAGSS